MNEMEMAKMGTGRRLVSGHTREDIEERNN
jgi:hypothetical protein